MPYKLDPILSNGLDDSVKIWRYVDFAKFTDLLLRKQQFFVSAKKLMNIDPYEGYFTVDEIFTEFKTNTESYNRIIQTTYEEHAENLFINCWHINDADSDAMWKLYSTNDSGIAIQSTLKKLKLSFQDDPQRIDITKINYVDYSTAKVSNKNILDRFSAKQNSYKHESELRVFVFNVEMIPSKTIEVDGKQYSFTAQDENRYHPIRGENGIYVQTKVDELIEKIYVSPRSPLWFVELVKSTMKKYDLDDNLVVQSNLYKKPKLNI